MSEHGMHAITPSVGGRPKSRTRARFANAAPDFPGQCAAANRTGERCRRRAVVGRSVCDLHGGKSLSGVAHPNFRHGRDARVGRYSLGDALGLEFERFVADEEALLSGYDEIALCCTQIQSLFDEISEETVTRDEAWGQIYRLMELLVRLRSHELVRIKLLHEWVSPMQIKTFMQAMQIVTLEVCAMAPTKELEREMRRTFARRIGEILNRPVIGERP